MSVFEYDLKSGQKERFVKFLKEHNLTHKAFAEIMGKSKSSIDKIAQGIMNIPEEMALIIERKYGLNHQYLLYGSGSPESKVLGIGLNDEAMQMLRLYSDYPEYMAFFNSLLKPSSIRLVNCFVYWLSQHQGLYKEYIKRKTYTKPISSDIPSEYRQGMMLRDFIGEITAFVVDNPIHETREDWVSVLEHIWYYSFGIRIKDNDDIKYIVELLIQKEAYAVLSVLINGIANNQYSAMPTYRKQKSKLLARLENIMANKRDEYPEDSEMWDYYDNLVETVISGIDDFDPYGIRRRINGKYNEI